jgi:hypothetical protein
VEQCFVVQFFAASAICCIDSAVKVGYALRAISRSFAEDEKKRRREEDKKRGQLWNGPHRLLKRFASTAKSTPTPARSCKRGASTHFHRRAPHSSEWVGRDVIFAR